MYEHVYANSIIILITELSALWPCAIFRFTIFVSNNFILYPDSDSFQKMLKWISLYNIEFKNTIKNSFIRFVDKKQHMFSVSVLIFCLLVPYYLEKHVFCLLHTVMSILKLVNDSDKATRLWLYNQKTLVACYIPSTF